MTSSFLNVLKCINICLLFANIISGQESCTTPALESGYCVPYKDCPFVNNLVKNYGSTDSIPKYYLAYISKSKCSPDNQPISLCCKFPSDYKPATQTLPPMRSTATDSQMSDDLDPNKDFLSQVNADGLSILTNQRCGLSGGDKVAGGTETQLAEFPWMALLRYESPGDEYKCGGSLISNRYVLTATHCVNQPVYPIVGVRLGEHDLATDPDCRKQNYRDVCSPVAEDFGIEKVITHPRYNHRKRLNDIALIKLNRDVEFKTHIKPVCLPITTKSFQVTSNSYLIAGWGATENVTRSAVLLKAPVPGLERQVCEEAYLASRLNINEKHICAGDLKNGLDTCKGDSGGPLIAFNSYTNAKRFIQYGIVASGGTSCNLTQRLPGIYTNVLTFLPWITNNIVEQ